MTTYLYSLLITAGAEKMLQTDPNGLTLTLIGVCMVFCCLIILYGLYSLTGAILSGKFKRERKPEADEQAAIAAAIALALEAESGSETEAAIATALHLYLSDAVHDVEPGVITFRPSVSQWNNKQLNFRKHPTK